MTTKKEKIITVNALVDALWDGEFKPEDVNRLGKSGDFSEQLKLLHEARRILYQRCVIDYSKDEKHDYIYYKGMWENVSKVIDYCLAYIENIRRIDLDALETPSGEMFFEWERVLAVYFLLKNAGLQDGLRSRTEVAFLIYRLLHAKPPNGHIKDTAVYKYLSAIMSDPGSFAYRIQRLEDVFASFSIAGTVGELRGLKNYE